MREALHLRARYRAILAYVGLITALVGLVMLTPLLILFPRPEEQHCVPAFLIPGVATVLGGCAFWYGLGRGGDVVLTVPEGGCIVLLSWLTACLVSAVPFLVQEHLGFTEALFESVSAWTTTGLSVIDVTRAHAATLLWRSVMQLAGGAGLAIIMLAALTGAGGSSLSVAEGRSEQLAPNVRASARLVMWIYGGYTVAGVVGLRVAGMSWFDALNHAFCAVSTGGFSTRVESIGYWDSPAIEAVTLVLMILGNLNFVTAWCLLRGRWRAFAGNGEVRLMAVVVPVSAGLVLWGTCAGLYGSFSKACRVAVFETVSALTTTGYSTVGYGDWNSLGILVMISLMLIGGASCSTAGGIKQSRVYFLYRSLLRELRRPFLPRTAVVDDSVWEGEERVTLTDARMRTVASFVFLYLVTWLAGTAVLAASGFGLKESLFEFSSALGTVGLSIGVTSATAPRAVLWAEIAGMLLGRLEFFVIFASVAKIVADTFRMRATAGDPAHASGAAGA